jgi:HEAT repeat protein
LFDLDLLTAGDARNWAEFDVSVRRTYWPAGTRCPPREALVVAACSADGYLREAAVHRLAVSPDPEALPLLLIRCVDWVGPVREAARKAVLSKLDESALRAVLPLLGVLRRRQVDDWMTTLFRDRLPDLLDAALAVEDRETRRWAHREALTLLSRERLLEIATRDEDFVVRTITGTALLDRGECVEELLAAGAPKVRVRALTKVGHAEAYLADRTSAVRTMAQALVLKAGGDPAAHYRALPVSFGMLAGLGETGTADDAERLEQSLTDARPRIRRAAVRGLRRVAPESAAVEPLLTDPSPAVARQVVAFLRGRPVDVPALQRLLFAERPLHTRRAAAAVLRGRDGWTRLHTDLLLLADPEQADSALQDIHAWLGDATGLYTKPPAGWRADFEAAFDYLEPAVAREVRFALGFTN